MRRRLDIASSRVLAPRVFLLDEPTIGLDPRNRGEVWSALRGSVAGGSTVLMTTQYLDEADQLAGQIVVLERRPQGREGTPSQLKSQNALLLAVAWPVLIVAVFLPLAVRRYHSAAR